VSRERKHAAAEVDIGVVLYDHGGRDASTGVFLSQHVFESLAIELLAQGQCAR
jgi:hypothetical protein